MSRGRTAQIENDMDQLVSEGDKPWRMDRKSHKMVKKWKNRRERKRAKDDPECAPEYSKYDGWEW
jgi:hypothetical protein